MAFQKKAQATGIKVEHGNMHMLFTGNPGTGKTTVARIIASMLFDIGVLKSNKLIEVERKDLVASYVGQTANVLVVRNRNNNAVAAGYTLDVLKTYSVLAKPLVNIHDPRVPDVLAVLLERESEYRNFRIFRHKTRRDKLLHTSGFIA